MTRVVVDPGVLIAALISPSGAPARLLRQWAEGLLDLLVSPRLLDELARTLERQKFRRYVSKEEAHEYVDFLARHAVLVDDPTEVEPVTPDPGDDYLVALSREAEAHVLVSGDPHLTGLERAIQLVMTPADFLRRLESD